MIRGELLHPEILGALAAAGHGAKVLIADALYPHSTGAHANAQRVHLNLRPGLVAVRDVLQVVAQSVDIEVATYMETADGEASTSVQEFQAELSRYRHSGDEPVTWLGLKRHQFYAACREPDITLLIATGETRPYSNVLLTIGVP